MNGSSHVMSLTENSSSVKVTTTVLGVISFPSFNIALNGMDAVILDGKGGLLVPVLTDLLGLAGADSGIRPSRSRGRLGASAWTAVMGSINLM